MPGGRPRKTTAAFEPPEPASPEPRRDRLTGLLDRADFTHQLDARLRRAGAARLIVADVMRFRRLNAALGPAAADRVLVELAERLAAAYPDAAPARIGDDEFAVALAPEDSAIELAAVKRVLEAPLRIRGFPIHPKLVVAEAASQPGEDADALMRDAGLAMEAARAAESAGGSYAASTRGAELSRLELEADMQGALARGELVPFFQPVVRLTDGQVAGFEALARWRHPRLGLLHPDEFLPLFSEAGLLSALGLHMIEAAARQLASWRAALGLDITVGVNVTCRDLESAGLVDAVSGVIRQTRLPAGALKLELTESEIMRDPDAAACTLSALNAAGASLAVDDFGMGFSSLAYLAQLPLQTLKIDRYFVRTMAVNEGSAKIIRSIVALGRDLGLEIVAEGVEETAAATRLVALGCHYGQGFGYARPLTAEEAERYMRAPGDA